MDAYGIIVQQYLTTYTSIFASVNKNKYIYKWIIIDPDYSITITNISAIS